MQKKTINRNIRKKLEEWLFSIKDETLRKDVEKSLLVSGGCIASMFLNEPVNDYDIYIQDKEVLLRLANYYSRGIVHTVPHSSGGTTEIESDFIVLDGAERYNILKSFYLKNYNLDLDTEDAKKHLSTNDSELAVRYKNLKENQIRLDISSIGVRVNLKDEEKNAKLYKVAFLSPNAISLTDNIQIVLRFYGNAEEVHKNFDFVHATNYYTAKEGVVINLEAMESLITKDLKYKGSLYPVTSMIRIKKFLKRGWNINAGEMLKIAMQISELDLSNPEVLEEQLIGIDIAWFSKLIEVLRGLDANKMVASYINEIIDRVFNNLEVEDE